MKKWLPLILVMMSVLPLAAQNHGDRSRDLADMSANHGSVPMIHLEVEQLPDLNTPRAGHALFYANGELTVAGGHTNGFVPTPTAEYYKDGKWHTIQMTYPHDFGFSIVLKSGKVLLAGGCEQSTGIGQTYTAELYDPQTHTFRGFGNMYQKRVWSSALELDSGEVVIAGNWYQKDGIEIFHETQSSSGDFKGKSSFSYVKDVAAERCRPYIFRMADGDALIIGSNDTKGEPFHCTFADRLKGDTVHIPLFETWRPLAACSQDDTMSAITDEPEGDFTYLMPVQDSIGQVAIARVCGTDIKLVPTVCPVPMHHLGVQIEYVTNFIVDRQAGRAYMAGFGANIRTAPEEAHIYILSIDYAHPSEDGRIPLTLYYTDPLSMVPDHVPLLTPDGNLLIAGGMIGCSNYTPSAAVWLLRVGGKPEIATNNNIGWWVWTLLGIIFLIATAALLLTIRRRREKTTFEPLEPDDATTLAPETDVLLMHRIDDVMERERLYRNSELKLSDLANAVGSNRRSISDCINSQAGCSFNQYINTFRTEHAKRIIRQYPDRKLSDIYVESGFANETSFFRTFKALTGMTPKEWKEKGL